MKTIHGGDIYRNRVTLDFSVNMNPLGIPEAVTQALHDAVSQCHTYPDIHAQELKEAVGRTLGISKEHLLFGNGASELFLAIVHGLKPKKIVIPVPSFYGYEHAALAVTNDVMYYTMKEENQFLPNEDLFSYLTKDVDMMFLANPNNPTGVRMEQEWLKRILQHCKDKNIVVVLDECFIEFCKSDLTALDLMDQFDNLILVRAFTKIFTIPGVRLGYMICKNQEINTKVARQLPEWNLSTFAQKAGVACMNEMKFIEDTREYLERERQFLQTELEHVKDLKAHVYPAAANFILLYTSKPLYKRLLEKGILVRDCSNFRGLGAGYYRVAVKSHEENVELMKVTGEIDWNE